MYQIKLDIFEGPFDLLLDLIDKQKLDIYDIPIARITEEYLVYLRKMKELNLDIASEFILMAITLIEIKTSSLLPATEEPEKDEISPQEAREMLVARLIEYKKFKNASSELAKRTYQYGHIYPREAPLEERFARLQPDFLQDVSLLDLARIYQSILLRTPRLDFSHMSPIVISVEERMQAVAERLKEARSFTFRELTSSCENRIEIIVTFLAILELFKAGMVYLDQSETFGELRVELVC
jgi:segregation and condensation protein A